MDKEKNKNKGWLFFFILGGLIIRLAYFLYGQKRRQGIWNAVKVNFQQFVKKEEKEAVRLGKGDESLAKFCRHTANIFIEYFIPSESNSHRPKILRTKSLLVIVVVLMTLKIGLTSYLFLIYPNRAKMENRMTVELLVLINEERQKNNLKPLIVNSVLSASALAKGDSMLMFNYFSHYGPDGKKPWDWISRNDYPYLFVGENLAMNFYTARAAHEALMASPTHKKNILNEKYEEVGLAVVTGKMDGENTNILVEMFASRQKPSLVMASANINQIKAPEVKTALSKSNAGSASINGQPEKKPSELASKQTTSEVIPLGESGAVADTPIMDDEIGIRSAFSDASASTSEELIAASLSTGDAHVNEQISGKNSRNQERLAFLAELASRNSNFISPNNELEMNLNNELKYIELKTDNINLVAILVKWSKYVYAAFLVFMIIALLVNIFVRLTIQHKPVIIETMIVILFISSLITIKLHFLEHLIDKIAIM